MNLLKKFFSMLFEDLHWKLLALFAAVIIWFVGMNMSDPHQNQSVSARLQLNNIEIMARDGIKVLNEDELRDINVLVLVRALRSDMEILRASLADPERFARIIEVSMDFRAVDSDAVKYADGVSVQRLRISPNLQLGFEHLSISPAYIYVYLDTVAQQSFFVQMVQHGEVPPGFELQYIRPGNERVTITGARTDLQNISLVQAHVDITGLHDDVELAVPLVVLDRYGEDMTERVQLSVVSTPVSVRVWQIRQADIIVQGTGLPAQGFAVAGISYELRTAQVVGSAEDLEEFESITAKVDLARARTNITQVLTISDWLPEGVSLRQGEPYEMSVTIRIEPIEERTFVVPRGNVRSRGVVGLYQIVDDNAPIRVTISGPRSLIAALNETETELEFDLRTLPIGVHTVPLMVELPEGLTLVGAPPTLLVQIHETAAQENDNDEYVTISPTEPLLPVEPPYAPENGYYYQSYEYEYPQGAYDDGFHSEELNGD